MVNLEPPGSLRVWAPRAAAHFALSVISSWEQSPFAHVLCLKYRAIKVSHIL